MRKIFIAVLTGMVLCANALGGTLVYINNDGEEKKVSGLTILSIDSKKMVVRVSSGTETIRLSQVIKYFDSDIRTGGDFDDGSGDYTVRFGQEKIIRSEKNNGRLEFTIPFDVDRRGNTKFGTPLRVPYMYLFVLVSDPDNFQRKMIVVSYPAAAKISMKNYDEAKMMEKATSLDRPRYHHDDAALLGKRSRGATLEGGRLARFPLNIMRNGKVIACYLVAWGKDSIVATKEWRMPGLRISTSWWMR